MEAATWRDVSCDNIGNNLGGVVHCDAGETNHCGQVARLYSEYTGRTHGVGWPFRSRRSNFPSFFDACFDIPDFG